MWGDFWIATLARRDIHRLARMDTPRQPARSALAGLHRELATSVSLNRYTPIATLARRDIHRLARMDTPRRPARSALVGRLLESQMPRRGVEITVIHILANLARADKFNVLVQYGVLKDIGYNLGYCQE